jgi:Ribbon-helix-helix domain
MTAGRDYEMRSVTEVGCNSIRPGASYCTLLLTGDVHGNDEGKRVLTSLYLDPPVHKALKGLSLTTRVPTAVYLREAIADLLKKYGVKVPPGTKP